MLKQLYVLLGGVLCGALVVIGASPYILANRERTHSLFVYGTLENNFIRYYACLCLVPETSATLIDYQQAGLNILPAPNQTVSGSIIKVSSAQLERIDSYEDVPSNYMRETINIDDTPHWVYIKNK